MIRFQTGFRFEVGALDALTAHVTGATPLLDAALDNHLAARDSCLPLFLYQEVHEVFWVDELDGGIGIGFLPCGGSAVLLVLPFAFEGD